jgi:hypothetical protein
VALDVLAERAKAGREELEAEIGALNGHVILGSAPLPEGMATFVRLDGDEGSRHRQYLWTTEGALLGYRPLRKLALPAFYPLGGDRFQAWGRRLDVSATVVFEGGALVIGEGDRMIRCALAGR